MKEEGSGRNGAGDIAQANVGDNAIQIGEVHGDVTILTVPCALLGSPDHILATRSFEERERALGVLSIALMLLTACIAVPQIDMKFPLWLAGCAAAGFGAWLYHCSQGGQR